MEQIETRWPRWRESGKFVVLALATLVVLIIGARLRTYHVPHTVDVSFYSVVGHGILHGQHLYSEIWDHKPPAPYLIFAGAELLFGYGPLEVMMLGIVFVSMAMLGVFAATWELTTDVTASLWAAVFWTVFSSSLWLESLEPNCETFINALLVWVFYLVLRAGKKSSRTQFFTIGLLLAAATMFKPIFAVHGVLFAWTHWRSARSCGRLQATADVVHAAEIAVGMWLATFAYFGLTGRLGIFFDSMVTYNLYYSSGALLSILNGVPYLLGDIKLAFVGRFAPALLFVLAAYFLGKCRLSERNSRLFIAYLVSTYIAVAMPGRFYSHYFQLWLPPFAIGVGWAVARMRDCKLKLPHIATGMAAIALAILIASEAPSYFFSPEQLSEANYGKHDIHVYQLAKRLHPLLQENEGVAQIGAEPGFYFALGRMSPIAMMFTIHLEGPLGRQLENRVLSDLRRNTPQLLILDENQWAFWIHERQHPNLVAMIQSDYIEWPSLNSDTGYRVLLRKGGSLEARMGRLGPEHAHAD